MRKLYETSSPKSTQSWLLDWKNYNIPDMSEFGAWVKEFREDRNESLSIFAKRIGLSKSYVSKVEVGEKKAGVEFCVRLHFVFGLSLRSLLMRADLLQGLEQARLTGAENEAELEELLEQARRMDSVGLTALLASARGIATAFRKKQTL